MQQEDTLQKLQRLRHQGLGEHIRVILADPRLPVVGKTNLIDLRNEEPQLVKNLIRRKKGVSVYQSDGVTFQCRLKGVLSRLIGKPLVGDHLHQYDMAIYHKPPLAIETKLATERMVVNERSGNQSVRFLIYGSYMNEILKSHAALAVFGLQRWQEGSSVTSYALGSFRRLRGLSPSLWAHTHKKYASNPKFAKFVEDSPVVESKISGDSVGYLNREKLEQSGFYFVETEVDLVGVLAYLISYWLDPSRQCSNDDYDKVYATPIWCDIQY